jgi:uncharacterized protein (DUF58 family)
MADAAKYMSPEFVQAIARLDLRARFIVEGFLAGLHRSPGRGFSVEFSDYRNYVFGDSPADIDWKVYARTDKFYVKRFESETNLRCVLVADTSASMDYSSGRNLPTKFEYAVSLAAALGMLLTRQGDRVGLGVIDEKLRRFVPPKSKRSHLRTILTELLRLEPSGRTDLAAGLRDIARNCGKRGLIVILSDLLDDPEGVLKELSRLRFRGHDVIVFQILDPVERSLAIEGANLFVDPETGMTVAADPRSVRPAFRRAMEGLIDTYRKACGVQMIDHVVVDTSTPFDKALFKFLAFRSRKR